MLELVRRCKYCKSSMMDKSPQSYAENPFCNKCYDERITQAQKELGPVEWVQDGHYLKIVPKKAK